MKINIDNENNEILILLNNRFYDPDSINQALNDFKEVFEGEIKESEKYSEIRLKCKIKGDLENISYDFCNYVLSLIKIKILD